SAGRSGAGCARSRRTVPVGSDRSSRVTPAARIRRQHRMGRAEVKSGVSRALKAPAPGYIYACTQIAFHVEHAEKGGARTLKLRNEPNLAGKTTRRRAPSPCPLPEGRGFVGAALSPSPLREREGPGAKRREGEGGGAGAGTGVLFWAVRALAVAAQPLPPAHDRAGARRVRPAFVSKAIQPST